MSSFRSVVRNAGWNLLGSLLPLLAAAAAMPYLADRLGTERFGLLTLGWVLIGYFSLFDFGIGRALTKWVAEHSGTVQAAELSVLSSSGTALAMAAGAIGALLVAGLALINIDVLLPNVDAALRTEAANGLLLIAAGILPTVGTAAFRGILEGLQRFKLLTLIRVPAGVLLFAAPCVAVSFTPSLEWALASMVATRWLVLLAHGWPCAQSIQMSLAQVRREWFSPLLRMGGWLTVSGVVGPVIVYLDRFVIASWLSAVSLAYYAAPFELVSRLLVLPVALSGALFPALAAVSRQSMHDSRTLQRKALGVTLACVLPLALLGSLYSAPLLSVWMGPDFAIHGSRAMQWLLVGFVFNAAAQIPLAALHGLGRAKQTALLHLLELPAYVLLLAVLVQSQGIEGAAIAWAARGAVDMLALLWLAQRAGQNPSTEATQ